MSSRLDRLRGALGFRLALYYAAVFLASTLALAAITYVLLAASLRQADHDLITTTLRRYAAAYQRGGLPLLNRVITADRVAGRYEPVLVRVIGERSEAVYFSMPADWRFDLEQLAGEERRLGAAGWAELRSLDGNVLEIASTRLPDGTLFQVGKSTERRAELLARYRGTLLAAFLSVALLAVAGGYALTHSALRPLRDLTATVRAILQTGHMQARVPVRQPRDTLGELSLLFNAMLDRIEGLLGAMRGSLDNVAHDLRTPLMRLRSRAESALESGGEEACREALADCLEESDRVASMLEILMDISEAETGTLRLQKQRVDLAGVVRDAMDLYADVAEDRGISLHADAAEDVCVHADRNRLRQVAANLLDNAVKYTPRGGRVELAARREGAEALLIVRDTGPGIPPEDRPRIFDRLYRGDRSRSERGLGLGLSLVRAIVEAHQGGVTVDSTPGGGSAFTVHLPACD
ncbi:MAG TPA: ATP-binding protein [Vicinamibacteria bacterium]